jgi:hypothetical protein
MWVAGRGSWDGGARLELANIPHGSTGPLYCKCILPVGYHSNEMRRLVRRTRGWPRARKNVPIVPPFRSQNQPDFWLPQMKLRSPV